MATFDMWVVMLDRGERDALLRAIHRASANGADEADTLTLGHISARIGGAPSNLHLSFTPAAYSGTALTVPVVVTGEP